MVPASGVQALAVVRNGSGVNRLCYQNQSLPILGNVWRTAVDARTHAGATSSFLMGYAAPSPGVPAPGGERLVNVASTRFFLVFQPVVNGFTVFRGPLPCDAALAGLQVYTQAGIVGGGRELCNAIDLTAGYW